jgi:hypothetical protein
MGNVRYLFGIVMPRIYIMRWILIKKKKIVFDTFIISLWVNSSRIFLYHTDIVDDNVCDILNHYTIVTADLNDSTTAIGFEILENKFVLEP